MIERIKVVQEDLTKVEADAIVNAANRALLGGGGVDGAIHRAAGPQLLEECRSMGGCATGSAKVTKAYDLPARFVIHTVGPVWNGGTDNEVDLLRSCHRSSLKLAVEYGVRTIAFPAISCGVYRFPIELAAQTAVTEVANFLASDSCVQKVMFVCFEPAVFEAFAKVADHVGKRE